MIVDLGRHNDTVMAFAHAIDQFTYRTPDMPVIKKTMKGGDWLGGETQMQRISKHECLCGKIIDRRGL